MIKWLGAIVVFVIFIVLAGAQGLFWGWALESNDLAMIMSFACGLVIGLPAYPLSKLAYWTLQDRERRAS